MGDMERFDPAIASQTPALDWPAGEAAKRDSGFGERPIGELVRAIVARLGQDSPWSTRSS
jgi:hypothetical protein